jgi:hypothetical protein
MPDGCAGLRDDGGDLQAARAVGGKIVRKLTEPVAAVRSTRAAVERQQQRAARQEVGQRPHASFLIGQGEARRARQR